MHEKPLNMSEIDKQPVDFFLVYKPKNIFFDNQIHFFENCRWLFAVNTVRIEARFWLVGLPFNNRSPLRAETFLIEGEEFVINFRILTELKRFHIFLLT